METGFIPGLLTDSEPLTGDLLSNLPRRELTHDSRADPESREESTFITRPNPNQAGAVISKIEDIFESVADSILHEKKELVIQLKTRKRTKKQNPDSLPDTKLIRFPSKSPQEAWKFAALIRILELSHEALTTGVITTKRDMYYRDPELFVKQAVVDRYVDDIAYTLGVERDALNVVAAAKGLIAGSFTVTRNDHSIVDYGSEPEGILMPNVKEIQSLQLLEVQWILVIEKEATFRTLSTKQYWKHSLAGKGIILTAKGYPDIQSRQMLHLLSIHSPHIPIFCLVDFDPDGLSIMSTYKYGSVALAHESAKLAVPSVRWLGVRSIDIIPTANDKAGLLKLTSRDRRIATRMLEKDALGEGGRDLEWRREFQVMLMLNIKAEIQILSSGEGGLENWLDCRLCR